jgi:hypothetical protein
VLVGRQIVGAFGTGPHRCPKAKWSYRIARRREDFNVSGEGPSARPEDDGDWPERTCEDTGRQSEVCRHLAPRRVVPPFSSYGVAAVGVVRAELWGGVGREQVTVQVEVVGGNLNFQVAPRRSF